MKYSPPHGLLARLCPAEIIQRLRVWSGEGMTGRRSRDGRRPRGGVVLLSNPKRLFPDIHCPPVYAIWLKAKQPSQVQWLTSGNPALWEAKASRSLEVRSSRPAWPTWWNPVSTKNLKISWVWWWAPIIPPTWKAEAGNHLNPGGGGCSEPRLCHCTPAWATRAKLHL